MSKFHSTISRRDFMKTLGLTGAGLGAAVAITPVFRDLDELVAPENANIDRPWWV
ncbi:hypothetical protein ES708_27566 [subsurface metagenome]